ncbi:MAG: fructose-bisphosphatase class II, partial [Anaerolineales bacterium]
QEIREIGARIRLIPDGDVAGALMTCLPESGIDALVGVGGTPEGVLAACAIRAMGGELQGKLDVRNQEEKKLGLKMGYSLDKVITMDDLVSSNDVFFAATGITDGELLGGVRYMGHGAETESLVIRGKTGTVRWINAKHNFEKLNPLSQIEY